ncbi:MAG: hypothetical protein ACOC9R_05310 [bacterium]
MVDQPDLHAVSDEAADPFDPEALRQGALADVDVEKVLTAVPVRRPNRTEFFRVHREWVTDTLVLERQDGLDRETYLVQPGVQDLVVHELRRVRLYTCINKRSTVFLWPAKLPQEGQNDGARRWAETALQVAEQAKGLWVKMAGNRDLGGYELFRAKGDLGEPQWPDKTFRDLIEIAFRDRLIDRPDHEVIRELNGEL